MLRTLTACAFALSTICAANAGQTGMASHYSTRDKNQNGSRTASGRPLRDHELTGAHRSLPFGSKVRVTGSNGRSVVVTITDRGPFVRGRIIDLSMGAARKLGFHGLARVRLLPTGVSLRRDGRTPSESCIRESASTHSGIIGETPLPRNAGLRIDHVLLSPSLAKRLTKAVVNREVRGREKASDHAPAWIELSDRSSIASLGRTRGGTRRGRGPEGRVP
jgi:3D (Asp-Asp-Asp) domain-containing protein